MSKCILSPLSMVNQCQNLQNCSLSVFFVRYFDRFVHLYTCAYKYLKISTFTYIPMGFHVWLYGNNLAISHVNHDTELSVWLIISSSQLALFNLLLFKGLFINYGLGGWKGSNIYWPYISSQGVGVKHCLILAYEMLNDHKS